MNFGKLLLRSLPRLGQTLGNTAWIHPNKPLKVGLATFGLTLSAWFSTSKVFPEEMQVLETDDDLLEGEVRELLVGPKPEDTILVINYRGDIYSIQSKCSHFGFNLAKGLLVGDKIICPLHNASFSIKTGGDEYGPVFNGLKTFQVQRVDGKIKVSIPKSGWSSAPEYVELGKDNIDKSKKIVIVGAGSAGLSAAETLRKNGYKGYIYLVTK